MSTDPVAAGDAISGMVMLSMPAFFNKNLALSGS